MATVSMKEMLDAGVHFGHQIQRWNPKMKSFVYTSRGGIHIIDLQKTLVRALKAAEFVKSVGARGGKMIFVGTKKQAQEPIVEIAQKTGQFYVVKRWLGGTLTNFETIKTSIDRLRRIDQMREKGELDYYSKKERFGIEKEYEKLNEYLAGIREMKEPPSAMFVVDLPKEKIAIAEAKRLNIPVVAIADTNSDPSEVEYPIPGNDDAIRSIKLFSNLIADAYLEGLKEFQQKAMASADKKEVRAVETKEVAASAATQAPERKRRGKASVAEKPEAAKKSAEGPIVVKVNKQRKLVAAGMAEVVEIQAELESVAPEEATESKEEK